MNLYKYVAGSRSQIAGGEADVPGGEWHELRLEIRGTTLIGYLDGVRVVQGIDTTFAAGGVGLWTKADSVTCFDDVAVEPLG